MILVAGATPRVRDLAWGRVYSCVLPASGRTGWALLSDPHIAESKSVESEKQRTAERLRRVVAEVLASGTRPSLVNGDLAWSRGRVEDYRHFLEIVRPLAAGPGLVLGVGNHDRRNNLLAVLGEPPLPPRARLVAIVDRGPYRFVLLDSLVDADEVGGEIGTPQLAWLEDALSGASSQRTLLLVHHPGRSASKGCIDFGALVDVAERHPCVQAIVTGHEHEFALGERRGIHRIGLPATAFPFEPRVPIGWVEAAMGSAGIDIRFHATADTGEHRLGWRQGRRPSGGRPRVDSPSPFRL